MICLCPASLYDYSNFRERLTHGNLSRLSYDIASAKDHFCHSGEGGKGQKTHATSYAHPEA